VVSKQEYMQQFGAVPKESSPRNPPQEISGSDAISKKREELELKRLEIELDKLSKPDTNVDYYSKMLELQQKSFEQQLLMQKQQLDLRLEIEKLKLMGDGESDSMLPYLQMLAPLLPSIINKNNTQSQPKSSDSQVEASSGLNSHESPNIQEEKEKMDVPTNLKELEEYKQAIKRGEISFDEAYEDFLSTPFASSMNKEQFKIKFEELKKSI